jgi:geranylgeranyl diphosphate synthase type II
MTKLDADLPDLMPTTRDGGRANPEAADSTFAKTLIEAAGAFDASMGDCLAELFADDARLARAMCYALQSGGKRLRPVLVQWSCDLCEGEPRVAVAPAVAVECIHTFSLIHDDLPAIDNDDLRRGRPACHRQFDEATAILAGDALLALAFDVVARQRADASTTLAMICELSDAVGRRGLIGGEAADLEGERQPPAADRVAAVHAAKTARLFEASCRLGAIAAHAEAGRIRALADYGRHLGLAFQAADDLLDILGTRGHLGKPVGKDDGRGKQTYPRAVGIEESRRMAEAHAQDAVRAIEPFGDRAGHFIALARFVVARDR